MPIPPIFMLFGWRTGPAPVVQGGADRIRVVRSSQLRIGTVQRVIDVDRRRER